MKTFKKEELFKVEYNRKAKVLTEKQMEFSRKHELMMDGINHQQSDDDLEILATNQQVVIKQPNGCYRLYLLALKIYKNMHLNKLLVKIENRFDKETATFFNLFKYILSFNQLSVFIFVLLSVY